MNRLSPRRDRQLHEPHPDLPAGLLVPDEGTVRAYIIQGICPYCGKGPYTVLAGHTFRIHGIDRFALREAGGLATDH